MLTKNISTMKTEVDKHIKADAVAQMYYWNGSRGCFIGCLSQGYNPTVIEDEYGIPVVVSKISDNIFQNLSKEDAIQFFSDFPDAAEVDNKDLSLVHLQFLRDTLKRMPEQQGDAKKAIDTVITGISLLADGKEWSQDDARKAAEAAAAAKYAAYGARYAAESAAAAAAAAYGAAAAQYAAYGARYAAESAAAAAAYGAAAAQYAAYGARHAAESAADGADRQDEVKRQAKSLLNLIKNAPVRGFDI